MQKNPTFIIFTIISLLLHAVLFVIAILSPRFSPQKERVMEVSIADIPRSTDFLPSKPGILDEHLPPPPEQPKPLHEEMTGRVPDLPTDTSLPPEKSFAPPPPTKAKETQQAKAEDTQQAKATEKQQAKATEKQQAREPQPVPPEPAPAPAPGGGSPRSLRDLTPSLGKLVLAQNEPSGGRGKGEGRGDAVGTDAKASEQKGVAEERGGGFRLTALNAPEIQYISYFASIKRKIELVWQYPYDAAVQGIEGELLIDFVIGRDGKLLSVEIMRSSGHKMLDEEAVRSIKKAAPFDPIPADYKIPHLQISGRFVYTHGGQIRRIR